MMVHPHSDSTSTSGKGGGQNHNHIKWGKVLVISCLFVAAKIVECRERNPFLLKHFKSQKNIGVTSEEIRKFEYKLLKTLNWDLLLEETESCRICATTTVAA